MAAEGMSMRRSQSAATVPSLLMETFQSLLAKKLSDALASAGLPDAGELAQATDPRFGDYQTNAALVLAKQRDENQRDRAEKMVARLEVADCSAPTLVAG